MSWCARGDRGTTGPRRSALLVVAALALAGEAAALNQPDQFCIGDPCVIASPKAADPDITLDFGTRAVVLQSTLELLPLADGSIGSLTIQAGRFSIVGNGQLKGSSSSKQAGKVTINVVTDIQIDDTLASGAVRLSGQNGGTLTLTTTSGSVSGAGRFVLFGDGTQASGGTLAINSAAAVTLTGQLDIGGGPQGNGGELDINAGGNVSVTNQIDLAAGTGGVLDLSAGGSLTLGAIDLFANGDVGDAGQAFIDAGGDVDFLGVFDGRGSDAGENCGDGADVDVSAGGDITIAAEWHMQGRGLDCTGGMLALDGARVFVQSLMDLSGTGTEGYGGDFDIFGGTLVRITGDIALDGGQGGGGDFSFPCGGDIEILADIGAQGRTGASPGGSSSDVTASRLTIARHIDTSGGGTAVAGSDLTLTACDLITQFGADIRSTGSKGSVLVIARDTLTLRGRFAASAVGGITLRYTSKVDPPDTTGTIFSPQPTRVVDPTLIPCRLCDTNADCTDNNDCTDDACDHFTACLHTQRTGPCEDGVACTSDDTCVDGVCVGGPRESCDDGTSCTVDGCFPPQGCLHIPVPGMCDDGDACTVGDSCSGGACVGSPIDCDDSDPCTDDPCSGGVCTGHPFNTAPCADADLCTGNDRCSNGTCVAGPPIDCDDHDACTVDSCEPDTGCVRTPIVGCVDSDHDGKPDHLDECTTLAWTAQPATPPNQNPLKFALVLSRLAAPHMARTMLVKGLFNVDPSSPLPLDPTTNGAHVHLADAAGPLIDVSLPAGAGCAATDGWTTYPAGASTTWQYRNDSGALPPGCAPGSARGIELVQIKDRRASLKAALQFKIKARNAPLLHLPTAPLTRLQVTLALAAQPAPGAASPQARAGQCAEALFTGDPIPSNAKPYCRSKVREAVLAGLRCKGR